MYYWDSVIFIFLDLSMSDLIDFDQSVMPQVFKLFMAAVEQNSFLETLETFRY